MKGSTVFSFLAGAAIGVVAAAAYLSSDKGEKLREKIKDAMDEGCDMAREGYDKIRRKVKNVADDVEDKVREGAEAIKNKMNNAEAAN